MPKHIQHIENFKAHFSTFAPGIKLAQEVYDASNALTKKTDYLDGFIYENDELQLIQHEEGRIVPDATTGNYEYEYYLKDHLGNNRVVFTTNPKTIDFTLNYESSASNPDDEAVFSDLDNIIEANVHDHTDAGSLYQRSQRLTGTADAAIGSVLTIPVGSGDRVSASVYAKYLAPTATNNPGVAIGALLAAAISGGTGGTTYEGAINSSYGPSGSIITNLLSSQIDPARPMAFLNLLFLPGEGASSIDPGQFTFKQISPSSSNAHALLALDEPFEAPGAGYLVVYLSNESEVLTEVYFDDLVIMVNEHPVVQTADYYPFGLTFNSYQRVTAEPNRWKFNGVEQVQDLGFDMYQTLFRLYDPAVGRFHQIDPLTDLMPGINPYNFGLNNPIRFADPTGLAPKWWIIFRAFVNKVGKRLRGDLSAGYASGKNKGKFYAYQTSAGKPRSRTSGSSPIPGSPNPVAQESNSKEAPPGLLGSLGMDTSPPEPNIGDIRSVEIPRPNPVVRGKEVLPGSPVTLNVNIAFNKATDVISNYTVAREKLNDIAEALIKDPRLSVFIVGNVEMSKEKMDELGLIPGNSPAALSQRANLNGSRTTARSLMNARARAVVGVLLDLGVDPNRISFGLGTVYDNVRGRRASMEIRNGN